MRPGTRPSRRGYSNAFLERALAAFLAWTVLGAGAVLAATIGRGTDGICDVVLDGPIASGDAATFERFLPEAYNSGEYTLCLNSAGGNLNEAVKIARRVFEARSLSTVLPEGSLCESACALIFMMGHYAEGDSVPVPSRAMHFTARLGFHRPALEISEPDVVSPETAQKAFDLAFDAAMEFLALASSTAGGLSRGLMEADLLAAAFATPARDMYHVDTVDRAARWTIDVFGYVPPREIDLAAAQIACANITNWPYGLRTTRPGFPADYGARWTDRAYLRDFYRDFRSSPEDHILGTNSFDIIGEGTGMVNVACKVNWTGGRAELCGVNEVTGFDNADGYCNAEAPLTVTRDSLPAAERVAFDPTHGWQLQGARLGIYPPETPLPALETASREIERRATSPAAQPERNRLWETCIPRAPALAVTGWDPVALWDSLGIAQKPVSQVQPGARVSYDGDARVMSLVSADRCVDLCVAAQRGPLARSDRSELDSCFETFTMWYKVRTADGQSGWMNGMTLDIAR